MPCWADSICRCHVWMPGLSSTLIVQALATCSEFRPSIDISVGGESSEEGVGAGKARTEFRSAVAA